MRDRWDRRGTPDDFRRVMVDVTSAQAAGRQSGKVRRVNRRRLVIDLLASTAVVIAAVAVMLATMAASTVMVVVFAAVAIALTLVSAALTAADAA